MNVDLTSIRRGIILFSWPITLAVAGLIGMAACAGYDDHSTALAVMVSGILKPMFWAFIVLEVVALIWLAYNVRQLWRWENGELVGGCVDCGGTMQHKDGRYGHYSVCRMCSSKRNGWH